MTYRCSQVWPSITWKSPTNVEQCYYHFKCTRYSWNVTLSTGYHEIPQDGFERLQITGRTDAVIDMNDTGYSSNSSRKSLKNIAIQTEDAKPVNNLKFDRYIMYQLLRIGVDYILSSHNIELKIFMVTILTMMVCMFIYFRAQVSFMKE